MADASSILKKLEANIEAPCIAEQDLNDSLAKLKIYGSDARTGMPIFTQTSMKTVAHYAFNSPSLTTSRIALRILANAMLLSPPTRQMFVDMHYGNKIVERLKNKNFEDEFLMYRLMFLTTYGTNAKVEDLLKYLHIDEVIISTVTRHVTPQSDDAAGEGATDPMQPMALTESLKYCFNLISAHQPISENLSPIIPRILALLLKDPINPKKPLDSPIRECINLLFAYDLKQFSAVLFPESQAAIYPPRLIELLDLATAAYPEEQLEAEVSPLVNVLLKIHAIAPQAIKEEMATMMLPTPEDRSRPLGEGPSFSARLLRLSTSALCPNSREALSTLLFEMSDKDATTFVRNVGYGFASGYLFAHKVPVPEDVMEGTSTTNTNTIKENKEWRNASAATAASTASASASAPVNPVTGQRLDKERPVFNTMTKAEKEREAERLMVLFDRLQKNGVITAEHPLRKMQEEGRFEELSDSETD